LSIITIVKGGYKNSTEVSKSMRKESTGYMEIIKIIDV
jgi:hypothetical protein